MFCTFQVQDILGGKSHESTDHSGRETPLLNGAPKIPVSLRVVRLGTACVCVCGN